MAISMQSICNHTCQCSRLKRRSYGASYGIGSGLPGRRQSTSCHQWRSQSAHSRGRTSRRPSAKASAKALRSTRRLTCMQRGRCNQHARREVQSACIQGGAIGMHSGRCHRHAFSSHIELPHEATHAFREVPRHAFSHIEPPHEATPGRARARSLLIRQLHSGPRAAPGGSNGQRTDCRCEEHHPCSPL